MENETGEQNFPVIFVRLRLKVFAACAKFFGPKRLPITAGLNPVTNHGVQSTLRNFTLVCHSEERSDEESAFDFSVLIERIGKSAKQMLHFVQHDTRANL